MFYNHERKLVSEWVRGEESLCPDCREPLIAKMGEIVIWHWAHKAYASCWNVETLWHICWKMVYMEMPGWEIEYPIEIDGKSYRLDAYNPATKQAREFVHSLSKDYQNKHFDMLDSDYSPLWIWDGDAFRSAYLKWERSATDLFFRYGLKRAALAMFKDLDSYLHFNGFWWRHWQNNTWFTIESAETKSLCSSFSSIRRRYAEKRVLQKARGYLPQNPSRPGDAAVPSEAIGVEGDGEATRFDL